MKFYLFISLVVIFACTKEEFEDNNSLNLSIEKEKSTLYMKPFSNIVSEQETICGKKDLECTIDQNPRKLFYQAVRGYSRISTWQEYPKMTFDEEMASKIGVSPNIVYSVKYLKVEVDVNTDGKRLFFYTSPYCGGTPVISSSGKESTDFENLGYSVKESGNPTILATHLIYVDCTYPMGSAVRKYYPRNPSELQWWFNLY